MFLKKYKEFTSLLYAAYVLLPFGDFRIFAGVDFEAPLFFLAVIFLLASCCEEKAKALFLLWALATKSLALWTALSEECCFWWLGMSFSETILPQMEHGDFSPCAAAPDDIQGLLWSCRTCCNLGREWSSSWCKSHWFHVF